MAKRTIIKGYVVQSEDRQYYYHRSGTWVRYATPAEAYVWSVAEAASILNAATNAWNIKPAWCHPAIYDVQTGLTVLTGQELAIATIKPPSGGFVQVPDTGGKVFDIQETTSDLKVSSIVGLSVSL